MKTQRKENDSKSSVLEFLCAKLQKTSKSKENYANLIRLDAQNETRQLWKHHKGDYK